MATVVGRGMRWTRDQARKAQETHTYIKVGGNGGELLLTGAQRQWKKPATAAVIYIPALRMAGNPADIAQLLQTLQVPQDQIAQYLASAYTAANTAEGGPMAAQFAAEVAAAQAYRDAQKAARGAQYQAPAVTLDVLAAWAAQLPQAQTVTARTATAGATAVAGAGGRAASPKRGGRKKSLAERLRAAQTAGKVLDVSNLENIKMVTRPTGKTAKIGPAGVPVVSSSFENFAAAMRQLGAGYEQFIPQYQGMIAGRVVPVAPMATGVAAVQRAPSPRVAAPQLAPLPTAARAPSPRQVVVPAIPQIPQLNPQVPQVAPLPTVGRAASPRGQALPTLARLPQGLPQIPGLRQ